jgi:iron complex outermembrane receptor protein
VEPWFTAGFARGTTGQAAIGTTPALANWTKPASVPYLNLFCDPTQFVCNNDATLDYIMGFRNITSKFKVNEKGVTADGPLFDLPAGTVKAAIGATYTTYSFNITNIDTRNAQSLIPILNVAPEHLSFWAVFTQFNVPLIGEDNRLPLVDGFELEGSWRHDQYDSGIGGTSNAKAAFNWRVSQNLGLTIRGAWGESFRAPGFGETSDVVGFAIFGWNLPTNLAPPIGQPLRISCTGGVPNEGSGAAKVFNPALGRGCNSLVGGVNVGGGNKGARSLGLRDIVNTDQYDIEPEKGTNWSLGFDLSPATFLQGLNIQATWYKLKVSGPLDSGFLLNPGDYNSPQSGWQYIVPSDLGCPVATNDAPLTCPEFAQLVDNVLANPRSTPSPAARSLIYWVNDSGGSNGGWEKLEGIDFTASYDWEWGGLRAFNVGITGAYYLHRDAVAQLGGSDEEAEDPLHTTISVGGLPDAVSVPNQPRMRYRARLGWANNTGWSVTGFFNYRTHYYTSLNAPPNVNNQCQTEGGTVGGGSLPCAISGYTNLTPPIHTVDLSFGYDTGDRPANEYLRNIGFQVIIQNLFERYPPYAYVTGPRPGAWATGEQGGATSVGATGRTVSLILTKTW